MLGEVLERSAFASACALLADCCVRRDAKEECTKTRPRFVARSHPIQVQEYFLRKFLGPDRVAYHHGYVPNNTRKIPLEQLAERASISGLHPNHQLYV
jgi:hypothetical protein